MDKIIIIGSGGHARSCFDLISSSKKYKFAGYIDNKLKKKNIIGTDQNLLKIFKTIKFALIGFGHLDDPKIRMNLFLKLKRIGFRLPIISSPTAYISKFAKIGEGTVIMHGAIINAFASVGINSIINTGAILEHDVKIGDNCSISPNATLNGGVSVGNNSFIGSKSVIINNINIGKNKFIKSNSLVKKNLL